MAHVDKWLTFPDMGHIVANYYNRSVVLLQLMKLENWNLFPPKISKKAPRVPWVNSESFRAYFFEGWLSTTSIIYGVAQSQEWRGGDLGR